MDVRNELVSEVKKYFAGPYENDETLRDYPDEIYASGLLFPRNSKQESEDMDEPQAGKRSDEDSDTAGESTQSRAWLLQNSIGIKCNLQLAVKAVNVVVEYARYLSENGSWKRHAAGTKKFTINLWNPNGRIEISDGNGEPESKITWVVNTDRDVSPRYAVLSVFLSNEMNQPDELNESGSRLKFAEKKTIKNQKILFQPSIKIRPIDDNEIFLDSNVEGENAFTTPEEESLDLLFRKNQIFAQGYNCSASWDTENRMPMFVTTEIIPVYDSKQILFSSKTDKSRPNEIDMVKLDSADTPDSVYEILEPIVLRYARWAEQILEEINTLDGKNANMVVAARENYRKCLDAIQRIREGLDLLEDYAQPEIFESFKITNRAMLYQLARYDFAIKKSKGQNLGHSPDIWKEGKYFWRPFQIAFLLMNLRGIGDTQSDEGKKQREIVDLLWFPTGGGKTEAYLALASFTMVLRRIRGIGTESGGLGVSVVMRYTLRLLTLQQFERASTLICALEILRRKNPARLGREPFLIGLWVGSRLTPNSWQDSQKAIERLTQGGEAESGSPAQLNFCPWCGTDISCNRHQNDYHVDDKRTKWTLVHCHDPGCDFYHRDRNDSERALPVVTVDHDIYRRCPSLLIATVDKFARLPWNPETSSLFGIVDRRCPRCGFLNHSSKHRQGYHRNASTRDIVESIGRLSGPDLIIQDELHLITGPLGTMVGLYETAVDYLSSLSVNRIGPKIVVSTATIRGVEDQVKKLYNRKTLATFPPPALDYGDSFFWWYSNEPGRRYVGLSYSHRSMKFALGRLCSSLLQRVFEIRKTAEDRTLDPYWTLVAYFNSTRELGGAIRLVEDDVKSHIRKMLNLLDSHSNFDGRQLRGPEELTGRRTGSEIKEIRKRLEAGINSRDFIDILLATNMISVGIDVDRLGLMVVEGQPKNVSEYIQATGRVGRRHDVPGLIFTLYNPYKPRDLSHYENFIGIHATLQKSVEPVGLTPFSDKAMERAMHAILISLVRLTMENLSQNEDAGRFEKNDPRVVELVDAIADRYVSVQELGKSNPNYSAAKKILDQFQDNWVQLINESGSETVYYYDDSKYVPFSSVQKKEKVMMTDFAEKEIKMKEGGFPKETPNSLRDVETEAKLFYV